MCRERHLPVGLVEAPERVEGEHGDMGPRRRVEDLPQAVGVSVHRGEETLAEHRLFTAARGAVPRARRRERVTSGVVVTEGALNSSEVHTGQGRHPDVADGLGLLDREAKARRAGLVVAGLALRPTQRRDLVSLGLQVAAGARDTAIARSRCVTASSNRPSSRASSPSMASPRAWSHGSSTIARHRSTSPLSSTARSRSAADVAARNANSTFAARSQGGPSSP